MADDLLVISEACDGAAGIIVAAMAAQGFDPEGWAADFSAEMFAAAQDVAACMVFAHGGRMV